MYQRRPGSVFESSCAVALPSCDTVVAAVLGGCELPVSEIFVDS